MTTNSQTKLIERSDAFTECLEELSPEAQRFLNVWTTAIQKAMADGGGRKSAQELIFQIAKMDKNVFSEGE